MGSSSSLVHRIDRKPAATTRTNEEERFDSQALALVSETSVPRLACSVFIPMASWAGALRYAVQRSGYDDFEVADAMQISHGYISRVLRGTANLSGDAMVKFMRITGSLAPLQWLAEQMGYELKKKEVGKAALSAASTDSKRRAA